MHLNNLRRILDHVKDFLFTIGFNVYEINLILNMLEQERFLYLNDLKFYCVHFLLCSLSELLTALHPTN